MTQTKSVRSMAALLNAKPQRRAGIVLGVVFLAICLGCASFQFGGSNTSTPTTQPSPPGDDHALSQSGSGSVRAGEELDVYYPVPFVSPPNLVVHDSFGRVQVVEQRPDRFRVKAPDWSDFTWKARGLPVTATPAQPAPALSVRVDTPAVLPAGSPPPEPIPADRR